jgi:predicted ATPase
MLRSFDTHLQPNSPLTTVGERLVVKMAAGTRASDVLLVERERSLATLAEALAHVRAAGEGRLIALGGEAGVGKTALLRRFCDEAEQARVLWGACEPLRTPRPLGPLVDVAEVLGGAFGQLMQGAVRPYDATAGDRRSPAARTRRARRAARPAANHS